MLYFASLLGATCPLIESFTFHPDMPHLGPIAVGECLNGLKQDCV